jgi:hypothetical protein
MKKADNFNPGKWLVENKLTNQSQLNEMPIIMDPNRKVDLNSIELDGVDPSDYPDFSDAYVIYAQYTDGTPLTEDELDEFNDKHYDIAQELALERF